MTILAQSTVLRQRCRLVTQPWLTNQLSLKRSAPEPSPVAPDT